MSCQRHPSEHMLFITTSIQRRCNWSCCDVVSTLRARWNMSCYKLTQSIMYMIMTMTLHRRWCDVVSILRVRWFNIIACILQYFLHVLGSSAGTRYRSGSTVLHDNRPLSSGTQSYDTKKVDWPVDQPLKKLESDIQVDKKWASLVSTRVVHFVHVFPC